MRREKVKRAAVLKDRGQWGAPRVPETGSLSTCTSSQSCFPLAFGSNTHPLHTLPTPPTPISHLLFQVLAQDICLIQESHTAFSPIEKGSEAPGELLIPSSQHVQYTTPSSPSSK